MRTDAAKVSVTPGREAGAGALVVFLLDEERQLSHPASEAERAFLERAAWAFSNPEVKSAVAGHGGASAPSMLALHRRAEAGVPDREAIRILAARAVDHARRFRLDEVVFRLAGAEGPSAATPVAEGVVLGAYRFRRYFRDPGSAPPDAHLDVGDEAAGLTRGPVADAAHLGAEVNAARDLINEPAEAVTPEVLAVEAEKLGRDTSLEVSVWREAALREEGYAGLISVGQGSPRPPCLIVLRYRPEGHREGAPHLALVGKGITFDTGGISLKPPSKMWHMKGDMSGAAAVLSAMAHVGRMAPSAAVTGIIAAAENYVGPQATRPGDIFRAKNGKSVMVDNTDAEGRLVLTDALFRAGEEGATHIVDIATLTGAAVRALGPGVAAILGNDPGWVREVTEAGRAHGEAYWELPLVEEYRKELRCDSADLKNIGGINAGTITAALFLSEFVPEGATWAHLDIAGPFLVEKPWKYFTKGATGFGVRTLSETARRFAAGS